MESKSNRFEIYPVIQLENGQFSISDETLIGIWLKIETEGKVKDLFYDGSIRDIQGWLNLIKRPGVYPIICWDKKEKRIVHIAWLKDAFGVSAWVHHVGVGPYHRGAWEAGLNFWRKFDSLKLLLGLTPKSNEKAIKFLSKIAKFKIVGEIPLVCHMAYEGDKRIPGVMSYFML